jgi:hypothetical protein
MGKTESEDTFLLDLKLSIIMKVKIKLSPRLCSIKRNKWRHTDKLTHLTLVLDEEGKVLLGGLLTALQPYRLIVI